MTELGSPWALLLLLPVLALPLQRWLTGTNRLAVADLAAVKGRLTLRLLLAWVPGLLQVLGLGLCVVALARPQVVRRETWVESEGLDIVLALDTSGSMRADDIGRGVRARSRLEVAKDVMADFVEMRPNDRIGVVVFGEEAFTQVPLTLDHQTLEDMLGQVEIGVAGAQGTAIGTAIAVSAKRLKDLDAVSRIVILLTDGRSNAGRVAPMEAAQAAAALGIKVYTVGVGAQTRGFFGSLGDGLDEDGLKRIAAATGGQFFRATDSDNLKRIYETINELEPSPAEVQQLVDRQEKFRWFAVPGLALLALQVLLSATWLRRGP
ncbi:MAG: VWA domain-containing protein [Myxococcota bacterium]